MTGDTGDAAETYLRERGRILDRLERVNEQISAWNEYDANEHLPAVVKRNVPRPELSRGTLNDLHDLLVAELPA